MSGRRRPSLPPCKRKRRGFAQKTRTKAGVSRWFRKILIRRFKLPEFASPKCLEFWNNGSQTDCQISACRFEWPKFVSHKGDRGGACVSGWMGTVSSHQRRSFQQTLKRNNPMQAMKKPVLTSPHCTLNVCCTLEWSIFVASVARRRRMPYITIWDVISDLLTSTA
jgi:hypothetical protein